MIHGLQRVQNFVLNQAQLLGLSCVFMLIHRQYYEQTRKYNISYQFYTILFKSSRKLQGLWNNMLNIISTYHFYLLCLPGAFLAVTNFCRVTFEIRPDTSGNCCCCCCCRVCRRRRRRRQILTKIRRISRFQQNFTVSDFMSVVIVKQLHVEKQTGRRTDMKAPVVFICSIKQSEQRCLIKAERSFETSAAMCQLTRCNRTEDLNLHADYYSTR